MNTISKSIVVALVLSFFSAQFAWASSTAEVVEQAIEKSSEVQQKAIEKNHDEFAKTGGKIVVGRDGSVKVIPNGPTYWEHTCNAVTSVKNGVSYTANTVYTAGKNADGYVVGVIAYPFQSAPPSPQTVVAVSTPVGNAAVTVTPPAAKEELTLPNPGE